MGTSHWNIVSTVKSVSWVTLSGNAPVTSYFVHFEKVSMTQSKGYVPIVTMIMSFNVLKYFSSA